MERATTLFEVQGHQPRPIAIAEAKRGTSDAVYGYYKMGKVMILKLREDYTVKVGALIVVGSAIADNNRRDAASGEVRALDVRTGELKWT